MCESTTLDISSVGVIW